MVHKASVPRSYSGKSEQCVSPRLSRSSSWFSSDVSSAFLAAGPDALRCRSQRAVGSQAGPLSQWQTTQLIVHFSSSGVLPHRACSVPLLLHLMSGLEWK